MPLDDKPFSRAIRIAFDNKDTVCRVASTKAASELLMDANWPARGDRHRDATETCLKVLEGYRSTVDAEMAFTEAANEAGILVGLDDR